jgi:hypothetical protein
MLPSEFGFIFLYVAAFGFSDYFVKITKITGFKYLIYYLLMGLIGFGILYEYNYLKKK